MHGSFSQMIYIERTQTDPYFNIAAEEYLLKKSSEEILMFWRNKPSVVVGKHQNTLKEVNLDFVKKNDIPVIRRISGGGTVYHDQSNINYTIITQSNQKETWVDFRKFTEPTMKFMKTLGIETYFEGKNNLTIKGKKFSGNAAHVFKNSVIHHGTLLFDTNLNTLEQIINHQPDGIKDKSIDSIRAQVTNIQSHLQKTTSINDFIKNLKVFYIDYFNIDRERFLSSKEIEEINNLATKKYKTWEWNFGYSPKYVFQQEIDTSDGVLDLKLTVQNGFINNVTLLLDNRPLYKEQKLITNLRHEKETLSKALAGHQQKKILMKALFPKTNFHQDS